VGADDEVVEILEDELEVLGRVVVC